MKTRNVIVLVSLFFITGSVAAQTRFYDVSRTFPLDNGVTYQADVGGCGFVTLYNKAAGNFVNVHQTFRDGSLISREDRLRYDDVVAENSSRMRELGHQIICNGFSAEERRRLRRDERLNVSLIICSDTGNVKEVHFRFMYDDAFATIPPATYHRIEQELKRQLLFTPTDFGRSMNYIFRGWFMDGLWAPPIQFFE